MTTSSVPVKGSESHQQVAVDLVMKNAFHHSVKAAVERVPSGQIDISRRRRPWVVAYVEDLSPQLIMADDRHTSRTGSSDGRGQRRLAAPGVSTDDDQARACATYSGHNAPVCPISGADRLRTAPMCPNGIVVWAPSERGSGLVIIPLGVRHISHDRSPPLLADNDICRRPTSRGAGMGTLAQQSAAFRGPTQRGMGTESGARPTRCGASDANSACGVSLR